MTRIVPDGRLVPSARAATLAAALASLGMAPITRRILGYLFERSPKRWVSLLILALPLMLLAIIAIRFRMLVGTGMTGPPGTCNRLDQNQDRYSDLHTSRHRLSRISHNSSPSLDAGCC